MRAGLKRAVAETGRRRSPSFSGLSAVRRLPGRAHRGRQNRWLVVSQGVTSGATRRSTGPRSDRELRSVSQVAQGPRQRVAEGVQRSACNRPMGRHPRATPALPAPGQTHSSGVGKEALQAMLARLRAPQKLIARRQTMALNNSGRPRPAVVGQRPQSQCALSLLRTGAAEEARSYDDPLHPRP